MNTLLEKSPEVKTTSDGPKYCHIVCACAPKMGLCGAYKPVQCGLSVAENFYAKICSVCKKLVCKECLEMAAQICYRCGE